MTFELGDWVCYDCSNIAEVSPSMPRLLCRECCGIYQSMSDDAGSLRRSYEEVSSSSVKLP